MIQALSVSIVLGNAVDLTALERLVLNCLAHHCDDTWHAWPSSRTLAAETGADRSSVLHALKRLQEPQGELFPSGILEVEPRYRADGSRSSNRYRVHLDHLTVRGGRILLPPPRSDSETGVGGDSYRGGREMPPRDPSVEPSSEPPPPPTPSGGGAEEAGGGGIASLLKAAGVEDERSISRILLKRKPDEVRSALHDFHQARRAGDKISAGLLVKTLIEGGEINYRGKHKASDDTRPYHRPHQSTESAPPHEKTHICQVCGQTSTCLSNDRWTCPGCGVDSYEQTIPALVAQGILSKDRMDRLPAKAREIIDGKNGAPVGAGCHEDAKQEEQG